MPLPITDPGYPALLSLIDDPPPVLYARGNEAVIASTQTVAIVGTREATDLGLSVARRVAQHFAEAGYVIISGLAKGIDTAGHEGALLGGQTIAVLGTPVDKIYPAGNKQLAERIERSGALVSEYPIGTPSHGQSFVERDRIQAGISVAVIPVQTGLKGGTQHTIRFAEKQGRTLLCPRPQSVEQTNQAYDGIRELIDSGRAQAFDAEDYPSLLASLEVKRQALIARVGRHDEQQLAPAGPQSKRRRKKAGPPAGAMILFADESDATEDPGLTLPIESEKEPRHVELNDIIVALEKVINDLAPHLDDKGLEDVWRELRRRRPG